MNALPRPAWVLSAAVLAIFAAEHASAYDLYLDHNTDGHVDTFENLVEGPVEVPIDIVVLVQPGDTRIDFATIQWEFGGTDPDGYCSDIFGSVFYDPYTYLPDTGPFTNIYVYTCVCRFRCWCDSFMNVDADIAPGTAPGLYRLATLPFSRRGSTIDCGSEVWPSATFTTGSDGPFARLVIREAPNSVDGFSWGRVKTLYR
jgi:hypothetical protein